MSRRPGFSLVELVIALAMFSVLLATAMSFYRQQGQAFAEGNDRMTLMQNLRYGVAALEQNLRAAGINVPSKQPVIVHAGNDAVSFNADYATRTANDFFAVYHDPALTENQASAVTRERSFTVPGTAWSYPDSSYFAGIGNSPAETITFFFAPDSSTARTDDYTLYRQVNESAPEVVARQLLRTAGQPFFSYYVTLDDDDGGVDVREAPAGYLPRTHAVPIHGSAADTGIVAATDSVVAIRVSYSATNGLTGERETRREITRLIQLLNAPRYDAQRTCGNRPILGTGLAATPVASSGSDPAEVRLSWGQAVDEYTGEQDVLRYVIWRRTGADPWGDPFVSVSPGSASYVYSDRDITGGTQYWYALVAQDCTPQYSEMASVGPVTAPS